MVSRFDKWHLALNCPCGPIHLVTLVQCQGAPSTSQMFSNWLRTSPERDIHRGQRKAPGGTIYVSCRQIYYTMYTSTLQVMIPHWEWRLYIANFRKTSHGECWHPPMTPLTVGAACKQSVSINSLDIHNNPRTRKRHITTKPTIYESGPFTQRITPTSPSMTFDKLCAFTPGLGLLAFMGNKIILFRRIESIPSFTCWKLLDSLLEGFQLASSTFWSQKSTLLTALCITHQPENSGRVKGSISLLIIIFIVTPQWGPLPSPLPSPLPKTIRSWCSMEKVF